MSRRKFLMFLDKLYLENIQLSDEASCTFKKWCLENNINHEKIGIGELMKFIIQHDKNKLWTLLVVWAIFGGDLIEILLGFLTDCLEGRDK